MPGNNRKNWVGAAKHPPSLKRVAPTTPDLTESLQNRKATAMLPAIGAQPHDLTLHELEVEYAVRGAPEWYPFGAVNLNRWQIPVIELPRFDVLPIHAVPFNKRGELPDPDRLLHCYVPDAVQRTMLTNPAEWYERLIGNAGVISPDPTIRLGDPPDRRAFAIRIGRAVGAYWAQHGLNVITNLRWGDASDWPICFETVPRGHPVAISNSGLWRDARLRNAFVNGVEEMFGRISPSVVYVHGTMNHSVLRWLEKQTPVIHIPTHHAVATRKAVQCGR